MHTNLQMLHFLTGTITYMHRVNENLPFCFMSDWQKINLIFTSLGKFSIILFLLFPQKIGFDVSCKLGDSLHERSMHIF